MRATSYRYSPAPIGSRPTVFYEIIQRKGGYEFREGEL